VQRRIITNDGLPRRTTSVVVTVCMHTIAASLQIISMH
jgi:hypothetical protein